MLGTGMPNAPFDRTFFNVTLGDILQQDEKGKRHGLTLYLADGTTLDVCQIEGLSDQYLTVRAYQPGEEACDTRLNLIPYGLIYRIELAPRGDSDNHRMGFRWTPAKEAGTSRRERKPHRS